jgi:hypothetical protein
MKKKDAWKQYYDLLKTFTRRTEVRSDIEVIAHATDRSVELILWDERKNDLSFTKYKTTGKRNVATLRELAKALNDACDFVEESNPEWAKNLHKD